MRTVSTAVLLLSLAVPAAAQQRRVTGLTTFAVLVSDPSGQGISGVRVTLSGKAQRSATTEGGRIAFENLPAGDYHFTFERDGYDPVQQDVPAKRGIVDVKVTMTPKPKPVEAPAPPPPPAAPEVTARPVVLDMPAFIEKNYVGKGTGKTTPMACAEGGESTLIQINEPMSEHTHADADEFIYVIAGQGDAHIGQRVEPLGAGVFMMIPRGAVHSFTVGRKKPLVFVSTLAGARCGSQQ